MPVFNPYTHNPLMPAPTPKLPVTAQPVIVAHAPGSPFRGTNLGGNVASRVGNAFLKAFKKN